MTPSISRSLPKLGNIHAIFFIMLDAKLIVESKARATFRKKKGMRLPKLYNVHASNTHNAIKKLI